MTALPNDLNSFKSYLINIANEKKAVDIREYDVRSYMWITDYIIVLGVSNVLHCKAMVDTLLESIHHIPEETYQLLDVKELKKSGDEHSGWTILDMGVVVIHCIDDTSREFYQLDEFLSKQGTVYHH